MRKILAFLLIFSITSVQGFARAPTGNAPFAVAQEDQWQASFTPDQLDNLLAPIALYPDPLLAQVLLAATFPDQIDEAARALRGYGNRYDIDSANWDVSVKAVAHYPTVLSMMADKIDWTTSVGQAYVNQSSDVMDAIQRLRREAQSVGNLVNTPQQEIAETGSYIYIYPANPQYIYVPTYDPAVVYFHRPLFFLGPAISFGIGFVIGAWLNHDCDWDHHRVFYHGWERGPAWVVRSRPFIHMNNIYVNPRNQNVFVNRGVLDHHVNYGALDRYHAIHRGTDFSNVRRAPGVAGERRMPPGPGPVPPHPDNQIIRRNIDPNDPRINANRGHGQFPPQPFPSQPQAGVPTPTQPPAAGPPHGTVQPPPRPQFPQRGPGSVQPQPPQQPPNSVFRGNAGGGIDWRDSSRRGQESRDHEYRPGPPANAGPPPRAQNRPPSPPNQPGRPHDRRPR